MFNDLSITRAFQAEWHEHAYDDRHLPLKFAEEKDTRGRACKKPAPEGSKDAEKDDDEDQGEGKVLLSDGYSNYLFVEEPKLGFFLSFFSRSRLRGASFFVVTSEPEPARTE